MVLLGMDPAAVSCPVREDPIGNSCIDEEMSTNVVVHNVRQHPGGNGIEAPPIPAMSRVPSAKLAD